MFPRCSWHSDSEVISRAVVPNWLPQPQQAFCLNCWTPYSVITLLFFLTKRIWGILGAALFSAKNTTFPSLPCMVKIGGLQGEVPQIFTGKFCFPVIHAALHPLCLPLFSVWILWRLIWLILGFLSIPSQVVIILMFWIVQKFWIVQTFWDCWKSDFQAIREFLCMRWLL